MFNEDDTVCVAGHSSDAELIAMSDTVPKARHMRLLLREMGAPQVNASQVFSDSEPAIKFVHADTSPSLKHMNARVRQVREMLSLRLMGYHHLSGSLNCSDALTKRLESVVFSKNMPARSWGAISGGRGLLTNARARTFSAQRLVSQGLRQGCPSFCLRNNVGTGEVMSTVLVGVPQPLHWCYVLRRKTPRLSRR